MPSIGNYINNLVRAAMGRPAVSPTITTINPVLGSTLIYNYGTAEIYADINVKNAVDKGFNSNTAVYAIVMAGAEKFGSIPRYLYDKTQKEEKAQRGVEVKAQNDYKKFDGDNDLTILLNRPNPDESQDAFFCKLFAYKQVCGEAFIWLNRDYEKQGFDVLEDTSKFKVLEMQVLPPEKMILVRDPENIHSPLYYILDAGGTRYNIPKTDIIHWKNASLSWDANTLEHLRGQTPLGPGAKTLEENNSMSKAGMRQAQNDGARGALANKTIGARPSPTQQTAIKDAIDGKFNNIDQSGKVVALEGEWVYLDMGRSAIDMDLREAKKQTWQELCALFGYPYELFDPGTTYANKLQAQKGWVSNKIMPACKQLDGELNRTLLSAFGMANTVFIGCDCSELPEMQIDMQAMATALAAAWWITPNEKREMMAEEPMDDSAMDEIWPASGLAPFSEQQANAEMDRQLMQQGMNDNNRNDKPAVS